MSVLAFILALVGLALMGLSQPQHFRWLFVRALPEKKPRLRGAGAFCLGVAIAPVAWTEGWAIGLLYWLGLVSLASGALLLLRTFLPIRSPR